MSLFLRTVLTWLLVLALPAQGMAAAMALCSQSPLPSSPAAVAQDHAPHAHVHGLHAAQAADPDAPTANADADADADADAGSSAKCSVCAACCNLVAVAALPRLLEPIAPAPAYSPSAAQAPSGFLPGGLERPPRAALA